MLKKNKIQGLLEARQTLWPLLSKPHDRLRDLLFLDIALDSTVRTAIERGYEELNNAGPEVILISKKISICLRINLGLLFLLFLLHQCCISFESNTISCNDKLQNICFDRLIYALCRKLCTSSLWF